MGLGVSGERITVKGSWNNMPVAAKADSDGKFMLRIKTPEAGGPHPANKQEVGRRLALWALSDTYGEKGIVCSDPVYKNMQVESNKAVISFNYTDGGLVAKDGTLNDFEIAGADGKFVRAMAVINRDHVTVSSTLVPNPKYVHYGWSDTAEPHLFNKAGLPASIFISDTSLY